MRTLKYIFFLLISISAKVQADDSYETFDVHFAVLTSNPSAHLITTEAQLRKEVDILNTYFVSEDRSPIIKFRFKSASFYNDIQSSTCSFVTLGDTLSPYDSDGWAAQFNSCSDPKVKDTKAINFYIIDSYSLAAGFSDTTSHGKRNSNRPYVLIDWQRLNHNIQSPEEHEMGHAFGLVHVCAPGATINTSTNIMATACSGSSGGLRDIGFDSSQVLTILNYVPLIKNRLGMP